MFNNKKGLIKDKLEIFSLIKRIQKSRQLISISFESLPQYSLTTLLDVHHDTKLLKFDESNPVISPKLIKTKKSAEFSLKLEQLPVKFKTHFLSNNADTELTCLYTHYPQEIFYPQNRKYYRFRTEFMPNINSSIFLSSKKRLQCELVNISLTGLRLRFPFSFASKFNANQLIKDIYVQLPYENGFSVAAKVKNTCIENNYSNITVGLEIYQQKSSIEKAIQQFIFRSDKL